MRKNMTKEVTSTTIKLAKMDVKNGQPSAVPLEDVVLIGNVSLEKAQKHVNKEIGMNVTVFEVKPETVVYEMPVDEFIKLANVKQPETDESEKEEIAAV